VPTDEHYRQAAEILGPFESADAAGGNGSRPDRVETPERPPVRFYTVPELVSLPDAHVDWMLKGYLARGMLTQLTGLPKEGKSTFVAAAAAAVSEGREFCGLKTTKAPVLYYTEEGKATFTAMMRRVCAADAANLHVLLRSQVFGHTWPEVCEAIRVYRQAHGIGLVVVDTFTDLSGLAGEDENVAGPVLEAIGHLRPIADDGAAVVIVRHDRKDQGTLIESGRGSGAFAGAVDVLMALRKKGESQREVLAIGRPEGVPDSVFVTFDGIEYSAAEDPRLQRDLAFERRLLAVLPREESQALGLEAIAARLDCSGKTAGKQLKRLRNEGAVQSGRGKGTVAHRQAIGWWAP
jgi:biotin operon repressor